MKKISLFTILMLMTFGCAPKTARVGLATDEPFSSTETSSKDLLAVAQNMTASLLELPTISNASVPPKIAFVDVKNETNEVMNKNLFIEKMRTLLIKNAAGKLVFLDRELLQAINDERTAKRSGDFTQGRAAKKLGADYFLTGKISSIDKVGSGKRSTYTRYVFRLTDTESSSIIWEDDYEVKKVGKYGLYDR